MQTEYYGTALVTSSTWRDAAWAFQGQRTPVRGATAVRLLSVHVRLGALLQRFAVPDEPFAAVVGHLEVLGKLQRVHRASVLTEPAEHATAEVVGEFRQLLAARVRIAFAAYHDQVFGTGQRTQVARDA